MKSKQEIFELLKEKFGEKIIEQFNSLPTEGIIAVAPDAVDFISEFLRDNEELKFDSLQLLSAVDDENGTKKTLEDGSLEIEGGTLSVYYHLEATSSKQSLVIKTSAPRENPDVNSVTAIWKHALFQEREAYDMIGINFVNHTNLQRILMPYDWDAGFPLRKDYKNPEFYNGMKVPT